ncbi:hypothetical protein CNMCM8980_000322 [Aspergillus fumigatiaffinis]|nr:hypothetical protein CNMCM8980_000322 [Aspergillus fumigatiaffinis]
MATKISSSSGPIANSAGHSHTLESMRLRHLSLDDSPVEALTLSRACLEVLERGDSLSWHLGAPFRVNIIQKAVSALFENPRPQLCGTEAAGPDHAQEWDDIVREFDPRWFEYHGGAVYRGHFRGQLVQLSENDWSMMQSGVPRMLVSPWPPIRPLHAELETIAYSITQLSKWNRQALEAIKENKLLLHTLARRIGWLHDHSGQSSSSAQVQLDPPDAELHIPPLATNRSATVSADMDVTERAGEVIVDASARDVRQSEPTQHVVHNEHESPSVRRDQPKETFQKRRDDLNREGKNSLSAWSGAYKTLGPGVVPETVLDDGEIPCQESAQARRRRKDQNRKAKERRIRRRALRASRARLGSCIN